MSITFGRVGLVAALTLLVTTAACTVESPASTPEASTPAVSFGHKTVAEAWTAARAQKRPLVLMFTSDSCPYCERMLTETFGHPEIRGYLMEHAETAIAHAAENRELVARLKIRGYPTTIVVDAQGQIVDAFEGYVAPAAFAQRIAQWIGPGLQASVPLGAVSAR